MQINFLMSNYTTRTDQRGVNWTVIVGFNRSRPIRYDHLDRKLQEKYYSYGVPEVHRVFFRERVTLTGNYPYWIPAFSEIIRKRLLEGSGSHVDENNDYFPSFLLCVLDEHAFVHNRVAQQAWIRYRLDYDREIESLELSDLDRLYGAALKTKLFDNVPDLRANMNSFERIVAGSDIPEELTPCNYFFINLVMGRQTWAEWDRLHAIAGIKLNTKVIFHISTGVHLILLEFAEPMEVNRLRSSIYYLYNGFPENINFIRPIYHPTTEMDGIVYHMLSMSTNLEMTFGNCFASEHILEIARHQTAVMQKCFLHNVWFNNFIGEVNVLFPVAPKHNGPRIKATAKRTVSCNPKLRKAQRPAIVHSDTETEERPVVNFSAVAYPGRVPGEASSPSEPIVETYSQVLRTPSPAKPLVAGFLSNLQGGSSTSTPRTVEFVSIARQAEDDTMDSLIMVTERYIATITDQQDGNTTPASVATPTEIPGLINSEWGHSPVENMEPQVEAGVTETVESQVEAGATETMEPQVETGIALEPQVEAGATETMEPQVETGVTETVESQVKAGATETMEPQVETGVTVEPQVEAGVTVESQVEASIPVVSESDADATTVLNLILARSQVLSESDADATTALNLILARSQVLSEQRVDDVCATSNDPRFKLATQLTAVDGKMSRDIGMAHTISQVRAITVDFLAEVHGLVHDFNFFCHMDEALNVEEIQNVMETGLNNLQVEIQRNHKIASLIPLQKTADELLNILNKGSEPGSQYVQEEHPEPHNFQATSILPDIIESHGDGDEKQSFPPELDAEIEKQTSQESVADIEAFETPKRSHKRKAPESQKKKKAIPIVREPSARGILSIYLYLSR